MTIDAGAVPEAYIDSLAKLAVAFFKDPKNRDDYENWNTVKTKKEAKRNE